MQVGQEIRGCGRDYRKLLMLRAVKSEEDIPKVWRDTPIGLLLEYHNLGRPFEVYPQAQLLIGMCMDNRKHLHMPDNFAFIIRSGGANLRYSEFKVSFAIGVGGVSHIALIGHTKCGMVNLASQKQTFIDGLVKYGGWEMKEAEEHFLKYSALHEIGDAVEFILMEVMRLRLRYPKVTVAPMFYKVEDNMLYIIEEE